MSDPDEVKEPRSYGRGAGILSVGIGITGLVTFAYFAVASHVLGPDDYSEISLLWIVMFVILSVIYRPIEQLLSRTISSRVAKGIEHSHPLRIPALIQAGFALLFLVTALGLREQIQDDLLGGKSALYWILVVGVLAYAASYFARGWLAGHKRFELYGGLVLFESCSRFLFPVAVAVGLASGQTAVALGIAAAPFASLIVVPLAFSRNRSTTDLADTSIPALDAAASGPAAESVEEASEDLSLRHGTSFAVAVFVIMLAEQALLNVGPLAVHTTASQAALTGIVFNLLLIARAPLQLFQSIQTSLLPHLMGLEEKEGEEEFGRAIWLTTLAIAVFAGVIALGLLLIGPWAMDVMFGSDFEYDRLGLALVAVGMGFHLIAGTLNQAALARNQATLAAVAWVVSGALFVGWMFSGLIGDQVLRVEAGYLGATFVLSVLLFGLFRRSRV